MALSEGCGKFLVARDNFKEHPCAISLYDLDLAAAATWPEASYEAPEPYCTFAVHEDPRLRINSAMWLPLNTHILVALDNGTLKVFDAETGDCCREIEAHPGHSITSMTFSPDKTMFITTSNDCTALLWDTRELAVLKTYECGTAVNSASIHPDRELVLLGGGQEARDVTTTAAGAGKFETRVHHMVHGHELGKVQGHFGPLNTCAWSPDGLSFLTGGEDGYARLHFLKEDWDAWGSLGEEPHLGSPEVVAAVAAGLDLVPDAPEEAYEGTGHGAAE